MVNKDNQLFFNSHRAQCISIDQLPPEFIKAVKSRNTISCTTADLVLEYIYYLYYVSDLGISKTNGNHMMRLGAQLHIQSCKFQ